MKEKITYALIVLLFSILVLSLALYYLFNGFSIRGDANIIKKYYDIKLNNVSIDYETDMTIKLDNENGTIQAKVPDLNKFKCLKLAYEAIEKGHSYQVVLNAANEVLVDAFLNKKIKYTDIPNGLEKMMSMYEKRQLNSVEDILEFDNEVKEKTKEMIS